MSYQGDTKTMLELMESETLFPEVRAKDGASGTPVVLSDGNAWLLCDGGLCNGLDELRDRIDDAARLRGEVDNVDIRNVAFRLLKANYALTDGEAAGLIIGTETQVLTDAVSLALFGPSDGRRTYTTWAAASLLANGVDPATVPSRLMPVVLDILVDTGRTVPASKFIESAEASIRLAAMRARIAKATPAPPAVATPAPEPEPS